MGLFDGIGQLIGGAVGGLAGGLGQGAAQTNYNATAPPLEGEDARSQRMLAAIQTQQGMTPQSSGFYQPQQQLVGQLQQTAAGNGPSAVNATMNHAQDTNLAQQYAMAASGRGDVNPATMQRNAMMNANTGNQNIAAQSMAARAQEQLNAQSTLGTVINQGRTGDINNNQVTGGLAAQYEGLGLTAAQAQLQAQMDAQKTNAGIATGNTQGRNTFVGGLLSGGSAMGAAALGA